MTLKLVVQDNHTTLELKEVVVLYHYQLVITVFPAENHFDGFFTYLKTVSELIIITYKTFNSIQNGFKL